MDSELAHAIEAYNLANVRLARIRTDLTENARILAAARASLRHARAALEKRVIALYVSGDNTSTLALLLGATSLRDFLNRVDAVDHVSAQDARVLRQVKVFRREIVARETRLKRARSEQQRIAEARRAQRASIERQIRERQRLLASIKDEIARAQAAERARQQALRREAAARLAARQRAAAAAPVSDPVTEALDEPLQASEPEVDTPPAGPARYGGVVGIAMQYLGTPYRWGGADPSGFDCSGFIMYVYAQVGVSLPHNAAAQFAYGTPVSRDQLEPGDLVFFDGLGHNGIYIGGGQFIHSPHTGDVVKISSLYDSWYNARWVGGRRL